MKDFLDHIKIIQLREGVDSLRMARIDGPPNYTDLGALATVEYTTKTAVTLLVRARTRYEAEEEARSHLRERIIREVVKLPTKKHADPLEATHQALRDLTLSHRKGPLLGFVHPGVGTSHVEPYQPAPYSGGRWTNENRSVSSLLGVEVHENEAVPENTIWFADISKVRVATGDLKPGNPFWETRVIVDFDSDFSSHSHVFVPEPAKQTRRKRAKNAVAALWIKIRKFISQKVFRRR